MIRTCIEGDFEGWDGESVFELCNGEVWLQASYEYTYHYAYRPNVTIISNSSGWLMTVEGVRGSITVTPTTDVVRSRIDGQFNGWDGDTVVVLTNGQVWRQIDFRLKLALRLSPRVLIYRVDQGSHRMKVDGVSGTVRVTPLR